MLFRIVFVSLVFVSSAAAATISVPAGADLQAALDAAQPGDVIELQPGATYSGNFTLPVKAGNDFIVLRTRADGLPGPGTRIDRSHSALLAKIRSSNSNSALATAPGAHHWRIELVEFQANARGNGDIIALGSGSQTDYAQVPYELVLDRLYVHGDAVVGQKRGVALNSGATQVINSYFEDFKGIGLDTQAICGWNGPGPYLIENNYTEAAGENILFGGGIPTIVGNVPSDITVRRNVFTKPLSWRSERWSVKNAFELKSARRVLIEGNIFEHVWHGGQNGYAVLFTVRGEHGAAPWAVVEDITFRYNVVRKSSAGINVVGHDNNGASGQVSRLAIVNNLFYAIDKDVYGGTGDFIQLGAQPSDIMIERNTVLHNGVGLRVYGGSTPSGRFEIERFAFRDNAMRHNQFAVKGEGVNNGMPTLTKFMPGAVFDRNVLAGGTAGQFPAGNYFPSVAEFEAQFVDPGAGNFTLVPGSAFRTAASDGGAVGADLVTLDQMVNGGLLPVDPEIDPGVQPMRRRGKGGIE